MIFRIFFQRINTNNIPSCYSSFTSVFKRDIPGSLQSRPIQSNPPLFFGVARTAFPGLSFLALLLPVPPSPNRTSALIWVSLFSPFCVTAFYLVHFVLCVVRFFFFLVAQQALLYSFDFLFVCFFCFRDVLRVRTLPRRQREGDHACVPDQGL